MNTLGAIFFFLVQILVPRFGEELSGDPHAPLSIPAEDEVDAVADFKREDATHQSLGMNLRKTRLHDGTPVIFDDDVPVLRSLHALELTSESIAVLRQIRDELVDVLLALDHDEVWATVYLVVSVIHLADHVTGDQTVSFKEIGLFLSSINYDRWTRLFALLPPSWRRALALLASFGRLFALRFL